MKVRSITIIFKDLIQNIKGENVCVCSSTILWMRSRRWNMYVFNVETSKIQTKTTKSLLHLWLQKKSWSFSSLLFHSFASFEQWMENILNFCGPEDTSDILEFQKLFLSTYFYSYKNLFGKTFVKMNLYSSWII